MHKNNVTKVIHANNVVAIPNIWSWVKCSMEAWMAEKYIVPTTIVWFNDREKDKEQRISTKKIMLFVHCEIFRVPRLRVLVRSTSKIVLLFITIIFSVGNTAHFWCQRDAIWTHRDLLRLSVERSLCFLACALCHRPKINFSDANFRTFIRKSGSQVKQIPCLCDFVYTEPLVPVSSYQSFCNSCVIWNASGWNGARETERMRERERVCLCETRIFTENENKWHHRIDATDHHIRYLKLTHALSLASVYIYQRISHRLQ